MDINAWLQATNSIVPKGLYNVVVKGAQYGRPISQLDDLLKNLKQASTEITGKKGRRIATATAKLEETLKLLSQQIQDEICTSRMVIGTGFGSTPADLRYDDYKKILEAPTSEAHRILKARVDTILKELPKKLEGVIQAVFAAVGNLESEDPKLPKSLLNARNKLQEIVVNSYHHSVPFSRRKTEAS